MLAKPSKPFDSKDWIFEFKYDGTRGLFYIKDGKLKIINRRMKEVSDRYPEFITIPQYINARECILDGEIIVEKNGRSDFYSLQKREQQTNKFKISILSKMLPAKYIVFDILYIDGKDLTLHPWYDRRETLDGIFEKKENVIISPYIRKLGKEMFKEALKKGFEGVMAKKIDSFYEMGKRSDKWLKIKRLETEDYIIIGYTKGEGKREGSFGALLLGAYKNGKIVYISRVGTGFNDEEIKEMMDLFKKIKTKKYVDIPEEIEKKGIIWVKPELVCEVRFMEKTPTHKLRAPSFIRLRFDKPPEDCKLS